MRIVLMVLLLLFGTACEEQYGLNRFANLRRSPEPECVAAVLNSIAEVTSIEEDHSGSFHRYRYSGEGFFAYASFGPAADDEMVLFLNERLSVNKKPSESEIALTRRMMRQVEARLASDCDLPDLPGLVREECVGINCRATEEE